MKRSDVIEILNAYIVDKSGDVDGKEILDIINDEYQRYISQKETMIVTLRDFQKKMSMQIDDIKFPELDKYLSHKYAYVKSSCFKCDLCNNFTASSKQSLSAHKRGCLKRHKPVSENTIIKNK